MHAHIKEMKRLDPFTRALILAAVMGACMGAVTIASESRDALSLIAAAIFGLPFFYTSICIVLSFVPAGAVRREIC